MTEQEIKDASKEFSRSYTQQDHFIQGVNWAIKRAEKEKEEFAVRFAEWVNDYYFKMAEGKIWFNGCDIKGEEPLTTTELLHQFKLASKSL